MRARQVTASELVMLAALAAAYTLLLAEPMPESVLRTANIVGPAALVAILATGCLQLLRRLPFAVLAPALWVRVAIAVYFGFGAVFATLASGETQAYMKALFPYDADMLVRLNLLNAFGTLFVLGGLAVVDQLAGRPQTVLESRDNGAERGAVRTRLPSEDKGDRRALAVARGPLASRSFDFVDQRGRQLAWLLLIAGLIWRFAVDLPNQFGLFEVVVPGALGVIGQARLAGYALLLADRSSATRTLRFVVFLIWVADVLAGLAAFAKTDTMLLAFSVLLAAALRGASLRTLVVGGLAIVLAYSAVRPLVDYGRERTFARYGSLLGAGFDERMGYIGDFASGERVTTEATSDPWSWLARFSYANVQALVVDRYDRGDPGDTGSLANLLVILIPRVAWTDKPVVSDAGTNLYYLTTGNFGTSIAAGIFAEAYWNGGWTLVALWSGYVGVVLGAFGRFAVNALSGRRALQLPAILMAVVLAARPDGWFGLTYVGGAAAVALLAAAIAFVERLMPFGGSASGRARDTADGPADRLVAARRAARRRVTA